MKCTNIKYKWNQWYLEQRFSYLSTIPLGWTEQKEAKIHIHTHTYSWHGMTQVGSKVHTVDHLSPPKELVLDAFLIVRCIHMAYPEKFNQNMIWKECPDQVHTLCHTSAVWWKCLHLQTYWCCWNSWSFWYSFACIPAVLSNTTHVVILVTKNHNEFNTM